MAQIARGDAQGNLTFHSVNPFDSDEESPSISTKKQLYPSSKSLNPFSDDDELPTVDKSAPTNHIPYRQGGAVAHNTNPFEDHDVDDLPLESEKTRRSTSISGASYNPFEDAEPSFMHLPTQKVLTLDKESERTLISKHLGIQDKAEDVSSSTRSWAPRFPVHNHKAASSSSKAAATGGARFPPVFKNKGTFGSQDFRDVFAHVDTEHHHHHGRRDKEVLGSEDKNTESVRQTDNLFGTRDVVEYKSSEKAKNLFGFEPKVYETADKGRDLFGSNGAELLSNRKTGDDFGFEGNDVKNSLKARHMFGGENSDDIDHEEYAASAPSADDYVNKAVMDLEDYAVTKSKETTTTVQNCLKVAEGTRDIAGTTLETLHYQGVQIERTHEKAVHLEQHLQVGEKLLNSLGGFFSKKWKPKKTRKITGPMIGKGESLIGRGTPADRAALGLTKGLDYAESKSKKSDDFSMQPEATTYESRLEVERKAQDDGLTELGNIVGQLKEMSHDMNKEVQRQSQGINHLQDDVEEIHSRVKQSNLRAQKLLRR